MTGVMNSKRVLLVIVSLSLASLLLLTCCFNDKAYLTQRENAATIPRRKALEQEIITSRPIIKTFFERIDPNVRLTGMSDEADDALLEFWNTSWYNAGWDPQIISIKDAQKHAEYDAFVTELDKINMDELSRLMFLRWLAMSASGGGWMADYDVFPLRDFSGHGRKLPHDGKLVVYDSRLLPQLVSGSAESYYKVGKALLETAKRHKNTNPKKQTFWTDSLALRQVDRESTSEILKKDYMIHERRIFKRSSPLEKDECDKPRLTKNRIAVHFGFEVLLEGQVEPHLRLPQHRLTIAKKWLKHYHSTCPWTSIELQ